MVQFLANILVYLFGSTYKYFLNVFKKRSAVEPPKPKEGLRFLVDGKEYTLGDPPRTAVLIGKFNQLLGAGVFDQDLEGSLDEWWYQVSAKTHCISLAHQPLHGETAVAFIYDEHNGVLIELGSRFDKANAPSLINQFMNALLEKLLLDKHRVKAPKPKAAKKTQAKPEAPKDKPTLEYKGRKSYKNRTAFVSKRKENYHGSE